MIQKGLVRVPIILKNTFRRVEASNESIGMPEKLDELIFSRHIDSTAYLSAIVWCPQISDFNSSVTMVVFRKSLL